MALSFEFILILTIVYGTSYLLKFLRRYDVPVLAVEILAGILFGGVLGIVSPSVAGYEVLVALAGFGLLMIMFDAGLELDPAIIMDHPWMIAKMALLTFFLPFLSGVALALVLGLSTFAAFLVGITVSTTSLGLIYPLLEDFDLLDTDRGQLILAVTVANDVLSVIALAYGVTLATAATPVIGVISVTGTLLLFFLVIPVFLVDRLSDLIEDRVFDNPVKLGLVLTLLFALVFEHLGMHAILGAFFAGLLIAEVTHQGHRIEKSMKPVLNMTAPVFFFYVGMNVKLQGISTGPLLLGAVVVIGIGAKMIGSYLAGWITETDRQTTYLLAAAMPGRLSISVAAAEIGRSSGLISTGLYDAFIILSVISVFLASFLFRTIINRA